MQIRHTAYAATGGSNESLSGSRVSGRLNSSEIENQYTMDTTPTPSGYWSFDENSGTSANDSSSNLNTGILTRGPGWSAGAVNSGLSFNGNNYVSMSNLQFGTSSFTAMAWFKTTNPGGMTRIFNQGVGNWNGGFNINMSAFCTGCLAIEVGGSVSGSNNAIVAGLNTAFNDGKWHQTAIVIDKTANTAQLYVDGVARTISILGGTCGSASGTTANISNCPYLTATTTDPFIVGAYIGASGSFHYFKGSIDEVRVYSSALSSSQILNLYTNDINALNEYTTNNASFSGTPGSTAIYTLPIALTYQLTPAPGWSLTITSTQLSGGVGTLPNTASTITSVTGICTTNGTCSSNTLTNMIPTGSFPLALPAGTTPPTAVKFFSIAVDNGTGAYTVTPSISVTIPATAKVGTYSSVITLTAATGP